MDCTTQPAPEDLGRKEPRNLVICCDGTGNKFGPANSNVIKLYSTLVINAEQVGYYHPGVGTMGAPTARNRLEKSWTILKGLAFGTGFLDNVGDAYRYLMNTYREGDRIFLFGFSRGAYTARAIAGLVHTCGLLCPGNEGLIPYALQMFAAKSKQTNAGQTIDIAHRFRDTFARKVMIEFVGVWDTVSSVGWVSDPMLLPDEGRNPIVRVARHALAIDERRCYYRDKLWGAPFSRLEPEFEVSQDIRQVWFAGVHSDVGGSYDEQESGLSKLALEWLLQEACRAGLQIKPEYAELVLGRAGNVGGPIAQPDPAAVLHTSLSGAWWLLELLPHTYFDKPQGGRHWRIPMGAHRAIPEGSALHQSVVERLAAVPAYRPPNLPAQYEVEPRRTFPAGALANGAVSQALKEKAAQAL